MQLLEKRIRATAVLSTVRRQLMRRGVKYVLHMEKPTIVNSSKKQLLFTALGIHFDTNPNGMEIGNIFCESVENPTDIS